MVIFVTGATAGFGLAMLKRFVENGDTVIAVGRREAVLNDLKTKYGDRVHPLVLDICDKNEVEKKIASLPENLKAIDVLINNAGLALGMNPAQKAALSDWEKMVETNINGLLYCTHAILPGMVERKRGHVINLGSVAGEFPYPSGNVYGATKAFVHQLSLNLRSDLVGTPVRVTCIEPGMCSGTEFSNVRFKGDEEKAKAVYAGVQALSPEDVAETVHWVLSRPAHVNINVISMMPVQQAFGPFAVSRKTT
jgi:3-hydroxy acid dehydrogenase/malonic semialdehyde reductase